MTARELRSLRAYEIYIQRGTPLVERIFKITLVCSTGLFLGIGFYFRTVKTPVLRKTVRRIVMNRSQLLIEEKKKPPEPPKPKKKPKPKPLDLTKKPELEEKQHDIVEKKAAPPKKIRRVYGVRKVYSRGIGAGGALSDAVIGKLGNTLNKEVDTLTATEEEITGQLVSITTVTTMPRPKKIVKPEYTEEMIENRVEGVVKAKVLVDVDGKVKKVIILSHLGYGTKESSQQALLQMEFEPAMRGDIPFATWIMIPVRFVLLQG